jgi:hypothetical protein
LRDQNDQIDKYATAALYASSNSIAARLDEVREMIAAPEKDTPEGSSSTQRINSLLRRLFSKIVVDVEGKKVNYQWIGTDGKNIEVGFELYSLCCRNDTPIICQNCTL